MVFVAIFCQKDSIFSLPLPTPLFLNYDFDKTLILVHEPFINQIDLTTEVNDNKSKAASEDRG